MADNVQGVVGKGGGRGSSLDRKGRDQCRTEVMA